jgi:hypothetical protein
MRRLIPERIRRDGESFEAGHNYDVINGIQMINIADLSSRDVIREGALSLLLTGSIRRATPKGYLVATLLVIPLVTILFNSSDPK